ncbi:MAG: CoA-binding protein [Chloroflexota bacterium]|nr:CoA-binding protein [Chloroflexota bacterium]
MPIDQSILEELETVFYPDSIAIVGAPRDERKPGSLYVKGLLNAGFRGPLYLVNPSVVIVQGIQTYSSLISIPGSIDYVIVNIAKRFILDLLDECREKNVKVIQIFTAGFGESDEDGASDLEQKIVQKARSLGIRVIGPNCIGVYNPAHRVSIPWVLPREAWKPGGVAYLCQSGGNTGFFLEISVKRGIRFSKAISYGNGTDIDSPDLLEYFGADPESEIVSAYIEGITDGARFFEVLKEVSSLKPTVIWKGGLSGAGARAAGSHTASLAGSEVVWEAVLKQAGAIQVEGLEELADTILAFQTLPKLNSKRVAVISGLFGAGGGASVASCDALSRQGLEVPVLNAETIAQLKNTLPFDGSIFQNPVDVGAIATSDLVRFSKAVELVFSDQNIDMVIIHLPVKLLLCSFPVEYVDDIMEVFLKVRQTHNKPLIVLSQKLSAPIEEDLLEQKCAEAQIPTYSTVERAAKAIANVIKYQEFKADACAP